MIGRYVLTALVVGLIAGGVLTVLQNLRLTPLILAAEVFEQADEAKANRQAITPACKESMSGMKSCPENGSAEWEPAPGLQRIALAGTASLLAGGGFAAILAGLSLLINVPVTRANGWVWGLSGFFAVHLATGIGLAPELPGMAAADLLSRQIWWLGTITATGAGVYFIAINKVPWAPFLGVGMIALPHIIGAPTAPEPQTTLPPGLAAAFVANALACAAVFWLVMGTLLGRFLPSIEAKTES